MHGRQGMKGRKGWLRAMLDFTELSETLIVNRSIPDFILSRNGESAVDEGYMYRSSAAPLKRWHIRTMNVRNAGNVSLSLSLSVPILDNAVQARRRDLATFLRMPLCSDNGPITRKHLMPHLASLPIPKAHIPATITGHDKLAVRTDTHVNGITRIIVTAETLLPVLAEAVRACVDDDLIVAGLESDVFPARVRGGAHHAVHVGLCDEFDGDGDVVFPCSQGFVVRGGYEAAVFVDECDGVDGTEMVVVFLGHFAGSGVELNDFLVGHAG